MWVLRTTEGFVAGIDLSKQCVVYTENKRAALCFTDKDTAYKYGWGLSNFSKEVPQVVEFDKNR